MRALHTADWHVGQTLNGWSREREHEVFFARLADVLEEEALPQSVWRTILRTGRFRRDSDDFKEALVARERCFRSKR